MDKKAIYKTPEELLEILVQNKDNLGNFISELYEGFEDNATRGYYNGLFGILKDNGYLNVAFADNRAYHVVLTTKGLLYVPTIAKKKWSDACMSFNLLVGQYRLDLLRIIERYPRDSVIPVNSEFEESIDILRTKGYLARFERFIDGSWGVSYTYDDINYLLLEEEYIANQERTNMHINVEGGNNQINLASGQATISATQNNGIDINKITELIETVRNQAKGLKPEDREAVAESTDVIQSELLNKQPRKSLIKTALNTMSVIKGTVEFSAAVVALIQFVQSLNLS